MKIISKGLFFLLVFVYHAQSMDRRTLDTCSGSGSFDQICKQPEYQELKNKFDHTSLIVALQNYEQKSLPGAYNYQDLFFKRWVAIADKAVGIHCVEEKRRHFLVSVMLHEKTHQDGLNVLETCFNAITPESTPFNTPHGYIGVTIRPEQYVNAMKVSQHIRNTMFATGSDSKANPLILIDRVENRISIAMKWALFKAAAVIVHMLTSHNRESKKTEKEKKEKPNATIEGSLFLAELFQKIETMANEELETKYPILKTHEVKSLIDNTTWWVYDKKNWIAAGSLGLMLVLLFGIMYDKIPHISYHHYHHFVTVK